MSDISKKQERLAAAVYLITSFFSDQEPLKWKMRDLASELASLGLFIKDNFYSDGERVILETRNIILELITLLSMSKTAGLVSDTNFSVIEKELSRHLEFIGFPQGIAESEGKAILSAKFFDMNTGDVRSIAAPKAEPESAENFLKDAESKEEKVRETSNRQDILPEPKIIEKGHLPAIVSGSLKDYGAVSAKKSTRQSIIIGVLKRKKEIMIKDVVPLIKGCSEKTIQRELLAMVNSGVLKKVGEKRWSRYSLA